MASKEIFMKSLFEGGDWMRLYEAHPDPDFLPAYFRINNIDIPLFHGKISLAFWLNLFLPLPRIRMTFCGSPVTDLFPGGEYAFQDEEGTVIIKTLLEKAAKNKSWAVVVKDLPAGHPLEKPLLENNFLPVHHDPIWFAPVYGDMQTFLQKLSKGRRRGLEGRWKKFSELVEARPASAGDAPFIKKSYDNVRRRSDMQLEELSADFFAACLAHPSCKIFVFEKDEKPFAFIMLWQKGDIWFDKYMGTDDSVYRQVSFYSMSMLYVLQRAHDSGIRWYVAGQSAGKDKDGLGLEQIPVRLWIKPLVFGPLISPLLKRFMKAHRERVYPHD